MQSVPNQEEGGKGAAISGRTTKNYPLKTFHALYKHEMGGIGDTLHKAED